MPKTFWVIVATALVNRLGTMVGPFLPLFLLREQQLDEPLVSTLLAAASASAMCGAPVGGWLCDRVGRRPCLVVGMLANALTMLAIPFAPSLPWLVAALLLRTFTNDILRPATTTAIADVVPEASRSRAFGIYRTAINLGFGVASFVGGYLATRSFLALFLIDAGAKLLACALLFVLLPETRPASARAAFEPAAPPAPASTSDAGAGTRFAVLCSLALVVSFMSSQLMTTLPMSLSHRGGAQVEQLYGTLLALNGVIVVLAQLPISIAIERVRITTGLALGALLYGAGYGLVALPPALGPLAVAMLLLTLGETLFFPLASVLTAKLAPEAVRGRWFGALVMAFGAGSVLSPVIGSWVMRAHGDAALWLLSPALAVVAAVGLLLLGRGELPPARR